MAKRVLVLVPFALDAHGLGKRRAQQESVELGPDYVVRVTTPAGTSATRHPPPRHPWADPAYDLVHASIVPCHANLAGALRGGPPAETTGEDNLRTLALVFAAYASAERGEMVPAAPGALEGLPA